MANAALEGCEEKEGKKNSRAMREEEWCVHWPRRVCKTWRASTWFSLKNTSLS